MVTIGEKVAQLEIRVNECEKDLDLLEPLVREIVESNRIASAILENAKEDKQLRLSVRQKLIGGIVSVATVTAAIVDIASKTHGN